MDPEGMCRVGVGLQDFMLRTWGLGSKIASLFAGKPKILHPNLHPQILEPFGSPFMPRRRWRCDVDGFLPAEECLHLQLPGLRLKVSFGERASF